ncbi:MAG: AGE family epimerase/isomerase, partial [Ignavibacteria bacterium]|nr:AGE family epimerase/isomerase [Ignavibacteria bacterium]
MTATPTSSPDQHRLATLEHQYRAALLDDVIPFWERHSPDYEAGGYFTCLDREGKVFDTDKFVWLQGREVWMFSLLYNRVEQRTGWRDMARLGADFLRAHGMDGQGNWYFSLTREGDPLVQPYNIFSDCFAAMAFAQYSIASGDERAGAIAVETFRNIVRRMDNPKGVYSKAVPWTRPAVSLALPMIMSNLALQLESVLPLEEVEDIIHKSVTRITTLFLDKERQLLFENVAPDGSHPDTFDGRLINPGHGIESTWFLMDIAQRQGNRPLVETAVEIMLHTIEFGWDEEHGGIFYFRDIAEKPPDRLDWDQKLWWVHLETLVALLKAYSLTGRSECWTWFERIHEYTWARFPDPSFGEWFGYLNRRGEVLLPLKGGKWK